MRITLVLASLLTASAVLLMAPDASAAEFWAPNIDFESGYEAAVYDMDPGSNTRLTATVGGTPSTSTLAPGTTSRIPLVDAWPTQTCIRSTGIASFVTSDDGVGAALYQVDNLNNNANSLAGTRMIPRSEWGTEYVVSGYHDDASSSKARFAMVIAPEATNVAVTTPSSTTIEAGSGTGCTGISAQSGGTTTTHWLAAGEALLLRTNTDATGIQVKADEPVAVYSGSRWARIEDMPGVPSTGDMFLEAVPPVESGGTSFVACRPHSDMDPHLNMIIRVMALEAGTTTFTIQPPGATYTLSGAGSFRDIVTTQDTYIDASQDVQVSVYMANGQPRANPSMLILAPIKTWQTSDMLDRLDQQATDLGTVKHYLTVGTIGVAAGNAGGTAITNWRQIQGTDASCGEALVTRMAGGPIQVDTLGQMYATMSSAGVYAATWQGSPNIRCDLGPDSDGDGLRDDCDPCTLTDNQAPEVRTNPPRISFGTTGIHSAAWYQAFTSCAVCPFYEHIELWGRGWAEYVPGQGEDYGFDGAFYLDPCLDVPCTDLEGPYLVEYQVTRQDMMVEVYAQQGTALFSIYLAPPAPMLPPQPSVRWTANVPDCL